MWPGKATCARDRTRHATARGAQPPLLPPPGFSPCPLPFFLLSPFFPSPIIRCQHASVAANCRCQHFHCRPPCRAATTAVAAASLSLFSSLPTTAPTVNILRRPQEKLSSPSPSPTPPLLTSVAETSVAMVISSDPRGSPLPNFAAVLFSPIFSSSAPARSRSRCLHPSSQAPSSSLVVVATSLPSLFLLRHHSHPSPASSYPSPWAVAAKTTQSSATTAASAPPSSSPSPISDLYPSSSIVRVQAALPLLLSASVTDHPASATIPSPTLPLYSISLAEPHCGDSPASPSSSSPLFPPSSFHSGRRNLTAAAPFPLPPPVAGSHRPDALPFRLLSHPATLLFPFPSPWPPSSLAPPSSSPAGP